MNMFARFDENPAVTLRVIKETKRYGRTDNVKTVYPPQTKFAGGISHLELQREITLIELAPSPYFLSKVFVLHI